jgi:hypothetical protein
MVKTITKRYQNAQAHVNPTTNLLQVYRRHESSRDAQEMLAEFHAETYLYWESKQRSHQRKAEAHTGGEVLSRVGFFESSHDTHVFTLPVVPVTPAA